MDITANNVDVFLISETKIDDSFPNAQFHKHEYSNPNRRDRTADGGGLLLYINQNIPSKPLRMHTVPEDIEIICTELYIRKQKWIILGIYHPPNQNEDYFLNELGKVIDLYSQNYENMIIMGDFNMEPQTKQMEDFIELYDFYNLVKEKTCFKSFPGKCYDLLLTNKKHSFMQTTTVETGLSDHHKLTATVLKSEFVKGEPTVVTYRDYKNLNAENFASEFQNVMTGCPPSKYHTFSANLIYYFIIKNLFKVG